ncbi:unnamed protein product [Rhizophagus irregularis]|nr:unnamed protein product [Rhizophagus irregularis]
MIFRCFDFGKRETERNAGRLDNVFRNELVPDVWIVKFETSRNDTNVSFFFLFLDSGRLDDEFRNEPVNSGRLDDEFRNEPVSFATLCCSGHLDSEIRNEPIPDVWMMETNRNAGRNFWVKNLRLRLQDEISKFIFRSPSVRKNFEGSRVLFQHFEGKGEDERRKRKGKPKWSGEHFEGSVAPWTYRNSIFRSSAVLVWNLTFQSFHRLLLRHWTFDT